LTVAANLSREPHFATNPRWLVVTLTLCLGIQALTTDLYLPSLPLITSDLNSDVSKTQLTLSMLLVFFGLGQMLAGPLSDKWGRRPTLIVSLALYAISAIGAAMAETMTGLIVWRSLQGLFMSGSVVCARALPRDLYAPDQAAAAISKGLTGLGMLACISPVLGSLLVSWHGWRMTLFFLSLFGIFSLAWVLFRQPETIRVRQPNALNLRTLWTNWVLIFRNPQFRAYTLLSSASYGGLFVFLASSSFIFSKVFGQTPLTYGLWLIASSLCYIAGTFLCRRLLKTMHIQKAVKIGGYLSLSGGVLMAIVSILGFEGVWYFFPFHIIFMISHGINLPCSTAGAIGPFPDKAGTAAALSGFMMMIVAFVTGLVLGRYLSGDEPSVYPLTLGMGFWSLVIGYTSLVLLQKTAIK
jgi:DHA1 family bicyclomycin/chloramphenicol resistance-like MFS transporter